MDNRKLVTALDLGSSSVAVMVASVAKDGLVHIEGSVIVPSDGVADGVVQNIEKAANSVARAVRELEDKLGIKIGDVYTGVSGRHVRYASDSYYVYIGRDGEIGQEDIQHLMESMNNVQAPEGSRIVHMSAQSYLVDSKKEVLDPVGEVGSRLDGTFNFILAENEQLRNLEKVLSRVELTPRDLQVNALATAQAVTYKDERELGVAVVDLGAGTTDVCIFLGDRLRYAGVIPLGSDLINKDLRDYGILKQYVEELKVNFGSAVAEGVESEKRIKIPGYTPGKPQEISFRNLASIIDARLKDIVKYVMEEIRYSGYDDKLAAGIVLTGGGAGLKDIDKFFHAATGMEVRVASADVSVDESSREAAADYRLSTVVGLVKEGFGKDGATGVSSGHRTITGGAAGQGTDKSGGRGGTVGDDDDFRPGRGGRSGRKGGRKGAETAAAPQDEPDEDGRGGKGGKGGLFKWLRDRFDEIDDNEI